MVTRSDLIKIVEEIFIEIEKTKPVKVSDLRYQSIIDKEKGILQLKMFGWRGHTQVYGTLVDMEIINDKIIVHYDGLDPGIIPQLEQKGVPKTQIVMGWIHPDERKYTDYAVT